MKYIEHLVQEHRLLDRIHTQLERWLESPAELAPSHVESVLRAYLQALQRHEEFEKMVFHSEDPAKKRHGLPTKKHLHKEHEDLGEIKEVLNFILDNLNDGSYAPLKHTIENLGDRLRRHYRIEEEEIWPEFIKLGHAVPKGLDARMAEQERAIAALADEILV